MDKINSQSFKQRGFNQWMYEYTTQNEKKYTVVYTLTASGHVNEKLLLGAQILMDRDIRVGWNHKPTVAEIIENDGMIP